MDAPALVVELGRERSHKSRLGFQRSKNLKAWVDSDIRVVTIDFISISAAYMTKTATVTSTERLYGDIQQQDFADDRTQVKSAIFVYIEEFITGFIGRVDEQLVKLRHKVLVECG